MSRQIEVGDRVRVRSHVTDIAGQEGVVTSVLPPTEWTPERMYAVDFDRVGHGTGDDETFELIEKGHRRGSVRADRRARDTTCDHPNRCCSLHKIHVTPHRGCILR